MKQHFILIVKTKCPTNKNDFTVLNYTYGAYVLGVKPPSEVVFYWLIDAVLTNECSRILHDRPQQVIIINHHFFLHKK